MDSLLLSYSLSLLATTLAAVLLAGSPNPFRTPMLWVYLMAVIATSLGGIRTLPTMEMARIQEGIRAGLAALLGIQIGIRAARYNTQRNWDECKFQLVAVLVLCGAMGWLSIYLTQPPSACYRVVGVIDIAAMFVLLTVHEKMAISHPVDRLVCLGLGTVYGLYGVYRISRQFDEATSQFVGWCGTLSYVVVMLLLAVHVFHDYFNGHGRN